MTKQPDPFAQARRIAAEWEEARRDGADRKTQIARVQAARARRAAAMSEARIKAAVDKAVREALARPEFAETVDQLTETEAAAPAASAEPDRPLHEMTSEEWHAHRLAYWSDRLPSHLPPPMTIGELIAGRYEDEA